MTLYIPHSIFHLARLLYVRPETFGPYYILFYQISVHLKWNFRVLFCWVMEIFNIREVEIGGMSSTQQLRAYLRTGLKVNSVLKILRTDRRRQTETIVTLFFLNLRPYYHHKIIIQIRKGNSPLALQKRKKNHYLSSAKVSSNSAPYTPVSQSSCKEDQKITL